MTTYMTATVLSDSDLDNVSGGLPFLVILAATLAADFILEAATDQTPKAHAPTKKPAAPAK